MSKGTRVVRGAMCKGAGGRAVCGRKLARYARACASDQRAKHEQSLRRPTHAVMTSNNTCGSLCRCLAWKRKHGLGKREVRLRKGARACFRARPGMHLWFCVHKHARLPSADKIQVCARAAVRWQGVVPWPHMHNATVAMPGMGVVPMCLHVQQQTHAHGFRSFMQACAVLIFVVQQT